VSSIARCVSILICVLTGRQLFERNKNLEDESLLEEGATSVDLSQYSRDQRNVQDEDDNDDRVTFSDSD